jgi:hypothetical protein
MLVLAALAAPRNMGDIVINLTRSLPKAVAFKL